MEQKYMVVLWNESKDQNYDITEKESLQEAVKYLVQHGALFERQEIVRKVDWMPGSESEEKQTPKKMSAEEEALAKRPNPQGPPPEQPVTIGPSLKGTNLEGKKSIFEGVVPPHMIPMIQKDS